MSVHLRPGFGSGTVCTTTPGFRRIDPLSEEGQRFLFWLNSSCDNPIPIDPHKSECEQCLDLGEVCSRLAPTTPTERYHRAAQSAIL